MPNTWPTITMAVPTLNQAEFIEQTLDSLLSQGYPSLRIMVLDGGSYDGTLAILERYKKFLVYFRSCKDRGPWASILEAASMVEEGWFNWLNSDDYLLPGSLSLLASLINESPNHYWITGARLDVDAEGRPMRSICPWLTNPSNIVFGEPFLPQDATFFHINFFKHATQKVPADLYCIFDTVLHRAAWRLEKPLLTNCVFSAMRWHSSQITSTRLALRRNTEYEREDVKAVSAQLGGLNRLLRRATKTRFSAEICALLDFLISRGFFGARSLEACVYWPWTLEIKRCSVAEVYSLYKR
jgi:glycosyltransferase involved in cell wall biosynthesis